MSRHIPLPIKTRLYMKCGRRCAMPNCRIDLLPEIDKDAETNISENAHIIGFSKNGPRAEKDLTDSEKNLETNLIVVCSNCHTIIDKNPKIYTTNKLQKIKKEYEKEVLDKLMDDVPNVGFSELEDVLKYLASNVVTIQDEYTLLKPKEKINKNNLSEHVAQLILRGMIGSNQVSQYLQKHPNLQQGNQIRERFVQEYKRLYNEKKIKDDDLFYSLLDFASLHSNEEKKTRAGLSILVYLFEECEVFEK